MIRSYPERSSALSHSRISSSPFPGSNSAKFFMHRLSGKTISSLRARVLCQLASSTRNLCPKILAEQEVIALISCSLGSRAYNGSSIPGALATKSSNTGRMTRSKNAATSFPLTSISVRYFSRLASASLLSCRPRHFASDVIFSRRSFIESAITFHFKF